MNVNVTYMHNIPTWKTFQAYGVQQAYPTFEFTAEIYEYDQKSDEKDEKEAYRCAIILEIKGHYYCSGSCNFEIESIEVDVDGSEELSVIKNDVMRCISARAIKQVLRGTLCDIYSDQIYDQIIDKL